MQCAVQFLGRPVQNMNNWRAHLNFCFGNRVFVTLFFIIGYKYHEGECLLGTEFAPKTKLSSQLRHRPLLEEESIGQ